MKRFKIGIIFIFCFFVESTYAWYVTGIEKKFKSKCEYEDYIHIIKYPPILFMAPNGNPDQLWSKIRKKSAVGCLNGDCRKKVSVVCAITNGECSSTKNCGEDDVCVGHLVGAEIKHSCIVKKSGVAPRLNNEEKNILVDFY